MKQKFTLIFLLLFCTSTLVFASSKNPIDSIANTKVDIPTTIKTRKTTRKFSSLKHYDKAIKNNSKIISNDSFTEQGFQFRSQDSLINKKWLDMAENTFRTIKEKANFIDVLTKDGLSELPVAIKPLNINNIEYTVGIAKAVFKPQYAELTVFLKVELPTTDAEKGKQELILGASDIKLSYEGGIIGDARLNLISQFSVNFNSGTALLTLKGDFENPGTYAIIDCSGFKEMGLDANLKFSSGLIYPVDNSGNKKAGHVEADFKTSISDWNDLLVNISLPEFGVKGLNKTTFKLNTAVFDFSDLRNDESLPKKYVDKYYRQAPNLWRGLYVESLELVLPPEFKKVNKDKRTSFETSNLIIDGQGISGRFEGENIISFKEGNASKWNFSLDYFLIDLEVNTLKTGKFNGNLGLPVSELDSLSYSAVFQPDNYKLKVETADDVKFDVLKAEVNLTKDSYVEMKVKDSKFRPKAVLHGSMDISSGLKKNERSTSDSKKTVVNFKGVVFENMLLQTESPKFSVDYFGVKGKLKLANFPVTLNEIGLKAPSDQDVKLVFDIDVNLSKEADGSNGGSTRLAIKSKLDQVKEKWKFDGVDLERLYIKMEVAGAKLQGAIFIFEDDPTYGTGFAGAVGAKFTKGLNLAVKAKALFGRTDTFRYWFADAKLTLPGGIPIFPGFALNAFGGGIYNRMKMAGNSNNPDAAFSEIGASTSGVIYEPYINNAFGMKASIGIITQNSEKLFHATTEFGMAFKRSGGLQEVYFKGFGELVSKLPGDFFNKIDSNLNAISNPNSKGLPAQNPSGAISANVFIGFDFVNDIFQATSEVYINFGVLKGVGASGRAGWLDFYVSPDEWHILIGTPKDRIGVKLDLAILKIRTDSYFMVGDNLPGSPPPPPEVANLLGLDISQLDYMRDLNMLESGKGLAFGASLSYSTGDLSFLIFYARFDAGVGFDIMLKDYGDAQCKGASGPIGLDGWYANGQAYAYLDGQLGLTFKLFGKNKKFTIIRAGAAVLLQAKLPNPSWFRGYLGGKYNLLGGLIKGSFRFKVEFGDECEIIGGSPLDGIVVIGDLKPKDGAEVDVFAAPQVSFNLPINKVFEIPDDEGIKKYKIFLDEFSVKKDGQPIKGEVKWSDQNDAAAFYSHEILPPKSKLKTYVQLHFEEFVNGRWVTITDQGKPSLETKEADFVTSDAPKTIPLHNIGYMYPIIGQKYFYKDEYDKGYVKLKRGQNYLFTEKFPNWNKELVIASSTTGDVFLEKFSYNISEKQINYNLPVEITNSAKYDFSLKLSKTSTTVGDNVLEKYTERDIGDGSDAENNVKVKTTEIEGYISNDSEQELLVYDFRTSIFDTFRDKMRNIDIFSNLNSSKVGSDNKVIQTSTSIVQRINTSEVFDILELKGNSFTGKEPLIVATANLDDTYYVKDIYPMLYANYPHVNGSVTVGRDIQKIGVPPKEAVEPITWYLTKVENDNIDSFVNGYNPYRYNTMHYYNQDYEDLRYQILNSNQSWWLNPQYKKMISKVFPLIRRGDYKTTFKYVLPGKVRESRDNQIKYVND